MKQELLRVKLKMAQLRKSYVAKIITFHIFPGRFDFRWNPNPGQHPDG